MKKFGKQLCLPANERFLIYFLKITFYVSMYKIKVADFVLDGVL